MNNSNEILEKLLLSIQEDREKNNQSIQKAIENNPNKEPFDYKKLAKLYWRQSTIGSGLPENASRATIESYQQRYYLDHPDVQTIAEFASKLEWQDANWGSS